MASLDIVSKIKWVEKHKYFLSIDKLIILLHYVQLCEIMSNSTYLHIPCSACAHTSEGVKQALFVDTIGMQNKNYTKI